MEVLPITDQVYQVTLPIVNVFLVNHAVGLILIDAGPQGSCDLILEAIRQIGKTPEDLKHIIITHAHHDHAGGLAAILKKVDAQVYASPLCAEMLVKGFAFKTDSKTLSFLLKLVTLFGLIRLKFLHINPVNSPIKTVSANDYIPDETGLRVIHAPGHTAEQIALFYPVNEALLFAVDAAENINGLKAGFAYQSSKINSLTLKRFTDLPFKVAVFGHGSAVNKKKFNYVFK